MTDRALLEAAARAAGIKGNYIDLLPHPYISTCEGGPGNYRRVQWNPLQDDAQALRLAVKLSLQVTPGTYRSDEASAYRAGHAEANEYMHYQQDLFAATRRAIVRAAAAIGQGMRPPAPTLPDSLSDEEHVRELEGRKL